MKHIFVRSLGLIIQPKKKKLGQRILIKKPYSSNLLENKNPYLSDFCKKCLQNIKVLPQGSRKFLKPQHKFSIHHYQYIVGTLFTPQKPFISLLVVNVKLLASLLWVEKKKLHHNSRVVKSFVEFPSYQYFYWQLNLGIDSIMAKPYISQKS